MCEPRVDLACWSKCNCICTQPGHINTFIYQWRAGLSGGSYRPAAEWNTMCATSGWTFLLAPWSSEVIHAALIPTVIPLSWGAVAPSGPPRCSLWPPRRCALHLFLSAMPCGGWWESGRGLRKRPVVQSGSHDLCRTPGREKLIKWLGIATFCVQQYFSWTAFTTARFWGRFSICSARHSGGALHYFSNWSSEQKRNKKQKHCLMFKRKAVEEGRHLPPLMNSAKTMHSEVAHSHFLWHPACVKRGCSSLFKDKAD